MIVPLQNNLLKGIIMEKMNANFFQEMMKDLRIQARINAMESIVDPEEHMEAVEVDTYTFMLGARMAFNMIASKLFTSDEIEMDMSVFEEFSEEEEELIEMIASKKGPVS